MFFWESSFPLLLLVIVHFGKFQLIVLQIKGLRREQSLRHSRPAVCVYVCVCVCVCVCEREREREREREITPHVPELKDPFFFITPNPLWSYTSVQYHKNELLKKH